MKTLILILVLVCASKGCLASLHRRPPLITLREHTIATFSKISNATSVGAVFTAGEQIPAIKLSVDKAVRIVTADVEDAILAAHAIEQIATLSSAVNGANVNPDRRIEEDRRFEQLTECVDLCVTALPIADVARYVWGMTVLGSDDDEKYTNVINEYARRLNSQTVVLSAADIASMIWTVGCIKDVTGQSNHTFIREAAQVLSDRLQFGSGTTIELEGEQVELPVKLAVRTIWSLAVHNTNLQPLISQCLMTIFPKEDSASPLTARSSLSLLWCLTEFRYLDVSIVTRLLDTIVTYLHSPGAQSDVKQDSYQREVGQQIVRLYSSLLVLQDMCSDVLMAETTHVSEEQKSAAHGILERIRSIYRTTSTKLEPQQLLDAPLSAVTVILRAFNTLDVTPTQESHLGACLANVQLCLDSDSVSGPDACALLQAMCTRPLAPDALEHEAALAAVDRNNNAELPAVATEAASNNAAIVSKSHWLQVAGRLAVRSTQYCTDNAHDSAALINTAYAINQLGCAHDALFDMLYNVSLDCLSSLFAGTNAKLLVVLHNNIAGQTSSRMRPVDRVLHAQRVAEAVQGRVDSVKSPLLQAQAIEALRALSSTISKAYDVNQIASSVPASTIFSAPQSAGAIAQPAYEASSAHPRSPPLTPQFTAPTAEPRRHEGFGGLPFGQDQEEGDKEQEKERLLALVRAAASGGKVESNQVTTPPVVGTSTTAPLGSVDSTTAVPITGNSQPPFFPPAPQPASPVSEPRRNEDINSLLFSDDDQADTESERLLALVRAAASGASVEATQENSTPLMSAPISPLSSLNKATAESADQPVPVSSMPPLENAEYPVSPILTPDPTGPTGEMLTKECIAILPFEEDEGVAINTERLTALVRAAAGINDSSASTHAAAASPHAPAERLYKSSQAAPQDEPSEYPLSPLLTPDPTGPGGELRTKEGITILPFDEEEGVTTNTDRLTALVRAAASGSVSSTPVSAAAFAAESAPVAPVTSTAAVEVPKLPNFPTKKLKYLSAHRLARLHRAYANTADVNDAVTRAVRDEIAQRDWHQARELATIDATIARSEDVLMLLQDLSAIPTSTAAGDADMSALYASLLHNLEALVPSTTPTDQAKELLRSSVQACVPRLLTEALQLPQPSQKNRNQLLELCDRFLQRSAVSTSSAEKTEAEPSLASASQGFNRDLAFGVGVLEETLTQCKRQNIDNNNQSAVGKTLSFGKKLLTQFFRAFVN